jgi:hypothetical protein
VSPRFFYFQNANFGSLNLLSDVIQVPTGLNPLWILTWRGPTCGFNMLVGYISIYFIFILRYCSYNPLNILKIISFHTILDEDYFYIKIVAPDDIYDFPVLSFFNLRSLR